MLLADLADWLSTGGVGTQGTDLFYGDQTPPDPSALIMLRANEGLAPHKTMGNVLGQVNFEQPRIQVETRSTKYSLARNLMTTVVKRLDGIKEQTINGTIYHWVTVLNSEPISLGQDQNARSGLVMNFQVIKARSTA